MDLARKTHQIGISDDGEPIYRDDMPNDPGNVVLWEPEHQRLAKCGEYVLRGMGDACCHRYFQFRACNILGNIVVASVCQQCNLEYLVVTRAHYAKTNNKSLIKEYQSLVEELIAWRGCVRDTAISDAWKRFGYLRPRKKKKQTKTVKSFLPDDD